MPTFYNFRQNGVDYSFDDVFVPADLFRSGNLWTWGYGSNGQLGNATPSFSNRSTPVTTFSGGANWKQISFNSFKHVAAIKTDGTLWTWGYNRFGALGNATINDASTPITTFAGGTNWKQVECGGYYTAAIKTDGTLWTWGYNGSGQLGDTKNTGLVATSTPVTTFAGGNNWKQVSCGYRHNAAIKTDGTLWTWGRQDFDFQLGIGDDSSSKSTPVTTFAGGTDWKQVSCGYQSGTGAIKTDGTLWTWGDGLQLGNGATTNTSTPVTTFAGGTNWKQVSCGGYHVAAIKTDGTLWTWGGASSNRLGNADTTNRSTPVTTFAGGNNWKQVSAGRDHTLAIKADGTLWTWGFAGRGSLGTNDTTPSRSTPVTTFVGGTNWKQASAGPRSSGAVTYDDPVL
jgi:alpha-tubulin suppressor-like RCC1 family protein